MKPLPNATPLSERDLDERFQDFLRESCGETVRIAGYEYDTAHALKQVDPITYHCNYVDWLDSELGQTLVEHDGEYFEMNDCEEDES